MSVICGECETVIGAPTLSVVVMDSNPPNIGYVVCSTCIGKLTHEEAIPIQEAVLYPQAFWVYVHTSPMKFHRCEWDCTEPVLTASLPMYGISIETMQAKLSSVYMNIALKL